MFYDRFVQICNDHGITPSRAAIDAGLSKSTVSKWKSTPDAQPTGAAITKLCKYFNISVAELLGDETEKAPTETSERKYADSEILFALSRGGEAEITDAMFEEVRSFAAYIAQREAAKKKKE